MKESQVALMVLTKDAPQSAIRTVRSARLPHERVIVVSNGSCREADAEIAKALPDLAEFVRVRPARGLAHCLNIGIRLPAQRKWRPQPAWSVLTQDDVEFDRDWFARFGAGVAKHPAARHINLAYPRNRYSCMAIHRDLVLKMGWWDERFIGMFYEDDDWHLRLCECVGCAPGTRVHEKDKAGIFAIVQCARHDAALHNARAKDRARFQFVNTLSKAPNEAFFYKKWKRVETDGWCGKGLPGRFARALPEVEWYPRALLDGATA